MFSKLDKIFNAYCRVNLTLRLQVCNLFQCSGSVKVPHVMFLHLDPSCKICIVCCSANPLWHLKTLWPILLLWHCKGATHNISTAGNYGLCPQACGPIFTYSWKTVKIHGWANFILLSSWAPTPPLSCRDIRWGCVAMLCFVGTENIIPPLTFSRQYCHWAQLIQANGVAPEPCALYIVCSVSVQHLQSKNIQ